MLSLALIIRAASGPEHLRPAANKFHRKYHLKIVNRSEFPVQAATATGKLLQAERRGVFQFLLFEGSGANAEVG